MSKGSRPRKVNTPTYNSNYDKIFKSKGNGRDTRTTKPKS